MRKKILIFVTKSNLGGAQRYVLDIAKMAPKDRFEIVVATGPAQNSNSPGALINELNSVGIRTIFLPRLARDVSMADFGAYREIANVIKEEKPDVIHLNSSKAGGLGAIAGRRFGIKKIIFTSHGLTYDEDRSILQRILIYLATWSTFLLSHVVICISDDTARRARAMPGIYSKVHLIRNGIGPIPYLTRDDARAVLREREPSISVDLPIIGTIAEMIPNKGLMYALEACKLLREQGVRCNYIIIGSGDLYLTLRQKVEELKLGDSVHLIGAVPQAWLLMKAFDIFLLPSLKEGLPYVLLEAAQAKVPIVGSDIPGVRAVVHDGGGILVPTKDSDSIAAALKALLEDAPRRNAIGESLAQCFGENYSLEKMIADTVALY